MGRRRGYHLPASVIALASAQGHDLQANRRKRGAKSDYCPPYVYRDGVVLGFNLPLRLAPTMNVYANAKPWQRAKWRKEVDRYVSRAAMRRPDATTALGCRRRIVVIRHSSREPDEISVDTCGGKVALDRLVQAGFFADDRRKYCERDASWQRAKPGEGYLMVEVMEVSDGE